jgi:regulator of protease activity HflC (stomatin/prohibitin superfamily)
MLEFLVIGISILTLLFFSVVVVNQGTIAIITLFGKYQRIMLPGLRFKIPFIESIFRRVSIQNQSIELEFQAVSECLL